MESTKLLVLLIVVVSLAIVEANAQQMPDEFRLKVSSTPNIVFIGGGGIFPAGTVVTVEKAPLQFQGYEFQGWKIDGTWASGNPITISMDRGHDVEAVYEKSDTNLIKIDSIPRISQITIDGEIYLPNELPAKLNWAKASEHIISIPNFVDHNNV